jgi:hypothetical protein
LLRHEFAVVPKPNHYRPCAECVIGTAENEVIPPLVVIVSFPPPLIGRVTSASIRIEVRANIPSTCAIVRFVASEDDVASQSVAGQSPLARPSNVTEPVTHNDICAVNRRLRLIDRPTEDVTRPTGGNRVVISGQVGRGDPNQHVILQRVAQDLIDAVTGMVANPPRIMS